MPNSAERPKLAILCDWDNSLGQAFPSTGTTFALAIRRYKVPEVGNLTLPEAPKFNKGLKGFLDEHADIKWHRWRKPRKGAIEFVQKMRSFAEELGWEVKVDVSSGRKPHLHDLTYEQLRGLYPENGNGRVDEPFDNVRLNPGVKSPRFKGYNAREDSTAGYKVIHVEDDTQAAETEAQHSSLVYLLAHWYNAPAWRLLMWWGRLGKGPLPENIVRVRNFNQAFEDFKTRLADGRL